MTNKENIDSETPHSEAGCRFHKINQSTKIKEPHKSLPSLEVCDLGNKKNDGPHNMRNDPNDPNMSRLRNSEAGIRY